MATVNKKTTQKKRNLATRRPQKTLGDLTSHIQDILNAVSLFFLIIHLKKTSIIIQKETKLVSVVSCCISDEKPSTSNYTLHTSTTVSRTFETPILSTEASTKTVANPSSTSTLTISTNQILSSAKGTLYM